MKKALSLAAALIFLATPAFAQQSGFSGFYLGGEIGTGTFEVESATSSLSVSDSGFSYGLLGGYRHDLGNWVLGVEGKLGKTDASVSLTNATVSSEREWSIAGLAGYKLNPQWLLFGTIGYANLRAEAVNVFGSAHDTDGGATISLGVEYLVSDSFSLRGTLEGSSYDDLTTQGQALIGGVFIF